MNAKHQFKYTYTDTDIEEISPVDITFDMPGDVTLTQMLWNFESYLKACGFYFDGHLEIVDETLKDLDLIDELDGTLYEFDEEEPKGGCMADFDKDEEESTCCDKKKDNKEDLKMWDRIAKTVEDQWYKGLTTLEKNIKEERATMWDRIAKTVEDKWNTILEQEIKEERDIRENISKRADELKEMEERWKKISGEKKASILADVLKASGCYTVTDEQYEKESREALEKELKKNKWVHGICNPPSPDWKAQNKNK